MTHITTIALAASLWAASAAPAGAQVKTLPEESITAVATIEAIDKNARVLTIKREDGTYETIKAPAEVKRFSELKVGDKITARYTSSLVVRLKKPGEAAVEVQRAALTPSEGAGPGATVSTQKTVTATIVAIDPLAPSITVKGPNGWTYSRRVTDKEALAKVKVGDRLDITWNEAVLLSVTPPK